MEYIRPSYYKDFRCVAADCEDTCCAGWQIGIDEESKKVYEHVAGGFGNRLHNCIDWQENVFERDTQTGRCAFLNEDNLCDIYAEIGPEYLCQTCREFPRHREEYEDVREESLSLACPVAAQLILSQREPVTWITEERDEEEDDWDFDFLFFTKLMDARDAIFLNMQNRSISLDERMRDFYNYCCELQQLERDDQLFAMDELTEFYRDRKLAIRHEYPSTDGLFELLESMEMLRAKWPMWLAQCKEILNQHSQEEYELFLQECPLAFEQIGEQLMVYFIFIYFGGSVYDGEILTKAKMALAGTRVICQMCYVRWLQKQKNLSFHDVAEIAWNFSKEVEHSDVNLERMEEGLQKWGGSI